MTADRSPAGATVFRGLAWSTAGSFGSALCNFIATLVVTRTLGVEEFGRYSYLLWLGGTASLVASLGLARPVARFIARARGEGSTSKAQPLVRNAGFLVVGAGLGLGPCVAYGVERLSTGVVAVPAGLLTSCVVAGGLAAILGAALQGSMRFHGLAVATLMAAATLCLGSVAVALGHGGVERQFAVACFASAVLVGLQLVLLRSTRAATRPRNPGYWVHLDREFRDYWRAAALLLVIEAIVWQRPEVFFLSLYASSQQLGYYNAAWSLANRLLLMAALLLPVLQAQVGSMRYEDEADRMRALYARSSRWLCILAPPVFLLPAGLASPLTRLLYGNAYEPASLTLGILMAGALIPTVAVAGSAIVFGTDRMGFALKWGAFAAASTLALDRLLIPHFGAPGAAVANVAGQAVAVTATVALNLAPSGFRFPWRVCCRTVVSGAAAALVAYIVEKAVGGIAGAVTALVVGAVVYAAGILTSRVLSAEDWMLVELAAPGFRSRPGYLRSCLGKALGDPPGDRP